MVGEEAWLDRSLALRWWWVVLLVVFRLNLVFTFHLLSTHYLGDLFFVSLHFGPGFLGYKKTINRGGVFLGV